MKRIAFFAFLGLLLAGCESTYYNAMEKVGVHKREILIDRIEETQEAQLDAQEQFKDALEQFRAVVNFDGGELEDLYDRINSEYEDSVSSAETIRDRVDKVESVAEALFEEWQDELAQYSSANLRRDSQQKLQSTQRQYKQLISAMHKAEKSIEPVLATLKDNVLYLKHNLNARAINSLKSEYKTIDAEVQVLLSNMQKAINESNTFIKQLKEG